MEDSRIFQPSIQSAISVLPLCQNHGPRMNGWGVDPNDRKVASINVASNQIPGQGIIFTQTLLTFVP